MSSDVLGAYLALSDDLCRAIRRYIDEGLASLRRRHYVLRLRDRVALTLFLKIYSAFSVLVEDARLRRVESMHHLRTLVEAFVYIFVVLTDPTDVMAMRVVAEVDEQKKQYGELYPDHQAPVPPYRANLGSGPDDRVLAGVNPLGTLSAGVLGRGSELAQWYDSAYRLACQPAHIADLFEFMPASLDPGAVRGPRAEAPQALKALDHGLIAMLNTLRLANQNALGLQLDLTPFEERLRTLDATRRRVA
jgi:hypothetical protein